jgi:xanthine dehydrogenase accessory factor
VSGERDPDREDPPGAVGSAGGHSHGAAGFATSQDTGFEGFGPAADARVWETLSAWREAGIGFALLTVIESRGFTPQKGGAHMLVAADGTTFGTVGGGAIEREAVAEALKLLSSGGSTVLRRHLTQELGMCCGGEMTLFLEVIEPAPRMFVFGAGYIARPLAALAAGCGFRVTVVDQRPEWALPERFPGATVRCQAPEDFVRALESRPEDYAVVVTHDHALDQRLVQELLRRPLGFLGMIGSVPKQRKFALRLRARGFGDGDIARLHTPLGLPIGATTPEEIAVSAMAEIVAARRGALAREGWVPPAPRAGPGTRPAEGGREGPEVGETRSGSGDNGGGAKVIVAKLTEEGSGR